MIFLASGVLAYWMIRPNTSYTDSSLSLESWDVPMQAPHNAFTDMVYWNGEFYLAFRAAPRHGPSDDSKIVVLKSTDTKTWTTSGDFSVVGEDIRDPKMAVIGTRLFIYVIIRQIGSSGAGEVVTTRYSYTDDGETWTDLTDIAPANKVFWRPKTNNSVNWYCPIFGDEKIELYNTTDGINWVKVSTLLDGQGANEVDIEFLPGGRIIAVIRQQFGTDVKGTMIAVSNYGYTSWTYTQIPFTKLDGPCLFSYGSNIYAVARWQPEVDPLFQHLGSDWTKKRTSLYLIEQDNITYLTDLPSCGDTSYPAAVKRGSTVYISYYTNDPLWDFPWALGMNLPTRIRIAKFSISRLEDLADTLLTEPAILPSFPWLDYVFFFGFILISLLLAFKLSKRWKDKIIIKRKFLL
jgi:hypothetical protein